MDEEELTMKMIVVGNSSVGKTSVIRRFTRGIMTGDYFPTIGMEIEIKMVSFPERNVRLHLWDTAGQELHQSITKSYLKNAAMAFIVFDITNYTSFAELHKWITMIRENTAHELTLMLLGNKSDLAPQRVITELQIQELLEEESDLKYFEVSAKTGSNVDEAFTFGARTLLDKFNAGQIDPGILESGGIFCGRKFRTDLLNLSSKCHKPKSKNTKCC